MGEIKRQQITPRSWPKQPEERNWRLLTLGRPAGQEPMRQNGDGEVALEHLKFMRPIRKSKCRRQAEVRSGEGPTCPMLRNRQLTPDCLKTAFGNQGHFISLSKWPDSRGSNRRSGERIVT